MQGKSIEEHVQEVIDTLEQKERELNQELTQITAKKSALQSFLSAESPGERILSILLEQGEPTEVKSTEEETETPKLTLRPRKKKVAALATEKPYADITLGAAVCKEMTSQHNRKRRTPSDVAENVIAGGWTGRKGRATAENIRPKVNEILSRGYEGRTFNRVKRGVYTV